MAIKKMERVRFITHKGKQILYLDFTNITTETTQEGLETVEKSKALIAKQPKNSLLTLTNVKNSRFGANSIEVMKDYTKHNKPYVKKAAVIGIEGILKVAYYGVMKFSDRKIPIFNTIEEAKDWLVEE